MHKNLKLFTNCGAVIDLVITNAEAYSDTEKAITGYVLLDGESVPLTTAEEPNEGSDATVILPSFAERGEYLYEIRAGKRPILFGHIMVATSPYPAEADAGSVRYGATADLSSVIAQVTLTLKGDPGAPGKSAYQLALENGITTATTEAEWLAEPGKGEATYDPTSPNAQSGKALAEAIDLATINTTTTDTASEGEATDAPNLLKWCQIIADRVPVGALSAITLQCADTMLEGYTATPVRLAVWQEDGIGQMQCLAVSQNTQTQSAGAALTWQFNGETLAGRAIRLNLVPDGLTWSADTRLCAKIFATTDGSLTVGAADGRNAYLPQYTIRTATKTEKYATTATLAEAVEEALGNIDTTPATLAETIAASPATALLGSTFTGTSLYGPQANWGITLATNSLDLSAKTNDKNYTLYLGGSAGAALYGFVNNTATGIFISEQGISLKGSPVTLTAAPTEANHAARLADLTAHTENADIHVTAEEKEAWNNASSGTVEIPLADNRNLGTVTPGAVYDIADGYEEETYIDQGIIYAPLATGTRIMETLQKNRTSVMSAIDPIADIQFSSYDLMHRSSVDAPEVNTGTYPRVILHPPFLLGARDITAGGSEIDQVCRKFPSSVDSYIPVCQWQAMGTDGTPTQYTLKMGTYGTNYLVFSVETAEAE